MDTINGAQIRQNKQGSRQRSGRHLMRTHRFGAWGGEKLRTVRHDLDIGQREAAALAGVSRRAWRRWESGAERMPNDAYQRFRLRIHTRYSPILSHRMGLKQ